jgi:hypothetical protein
VLQKGEPEISTLAVLGAAAGAENTYEEQS